jgi:hypothetical protein
VKLTLEQWRALLLSTSDENLPSLAGNLLAARDPCPLCLAAVEGLSCTPGCPVTPEMRAEAVEGRPLPGASSREKQDLARAKLQAFAEDMRALRDARQLVPEGTERDQVRAAMNVVRARLVKASDLYAAAFAEEPEGT